jgi:hypothetical protein
VISRPFWEKAPSGDVLPRQAKIAAGDQNRRSMPAKRRRPLKIRDFTMALYCRDSPPGAATQRSWFLCAPRIRGAIVSERTNDLARPSFPAFAIRSCLMLLRGTARKDAGNKTLLKTKAKGVKQ